MTVSEDVTERSLGGMQTGLTTELKVKGVANRSKAMSKIFNVLQKKLENLFFVFQSWWYKGSNLHLYCDYNFIKNRVCREKDDHADKNQLSKQFWRHTQKFLTKMKTTQQFIPT